MAHKKSKLAKFFIYLVLFFILFSFGAIYIVMYSGINGVDNSACEEGYLLNEETGECELKLDNTENNGEEISLDNEESCTEAGGTWYEENGVCIGASEVENLEENYEESVEESNE